MNNIPFSQVELKNGFWYEKQKLISDVTINAVYDRFYDTGRVDALACKWTEGCTDAPRPHYYWDSDIAKWVESASYVMMKQSRPDLEEKIEHIIDMIEENQWEDGYFNSYFTAVKSERRLFNRNSHELYCCGHLIEAAIAYYRATGKDRFLNIMKKYVDLVDRLFRVERSANFSTPGHEEIELALFKLYELTGEESYLRLAKFFVDERGRGRYLNDNINEPIADRRWNLSGEYAQSHLPVREQHEAVGHAVRAHYLYTAMADYTRITGDEKLGEACRDLFEDIVSKKMYITGSCGSSYLCEAYTSPYDLPNEKAYAETCAAISLAFFADRMLKLELDSRYADTVERAIYNGVLSGISLDGKGFFYENPLEINLFNHGRHGRDLIIAQRQFDRLPITQRLEVFGCSCCPPNISRLVASIGDYIYSAEDGTLAVNQFAANEATFGGMKIEQITDYPVSGKVTLKTEGVKTLKVRIPGWCKKFDINASYRMEKGYAVIDAPAGEIEVDFDMPVELVYTNAKAFHNIRRVAVCRGPIVYCLEGQDNGTANLNALAIDRNARASVKVGEVTSLPEIEIAGQEIVAGEALYSTEAPKTCDKTLRFIPYHAFANRGSDNMLVFVFVC